MHPLLNQARFFHKQKFPEDLTHQEIIAKIKASKHEDVLAEEPEEESEEEKEGGELAKQMEELKLDDQSAEYERLIHGLKNNEFKNIVVMTGAGISVSAGIPDFRSPGTGVYSNLQKYNLPTPEALFQIDYFVHNPQAFYDFAQNFDLTKFNPTPTHFFIKMLQDKGLLLLNPTQNIDNLEEKTGMDMTKVIQAHGAN